MKTHAAFAIRTELGPKVITGRAGGTVKTLCGRTVDREDTGVGEAMDCHQCWKAVQARGRIIESGLYLSNR